MLKIEFDTDNAAYHFDGEDEDVDAEAVSATLENIVSLINNGFTSGIVIDPNGASVGHWSLDSSD